VRVNAAGTPWHPDDLGGLRDCHGLRGIVLPKTQGPATVRRVQRALPRTRILALIETAVGLQDALSVAACAAVSGLAFGSIDFALDIEADESDEALLFARSALVVASRAAGLPPPIDGVTVETRDIEVVRAAAVRARRLGFGGKLCIHPAQVDPVNHAFGPDPAEIDWAQSVLAAATAQSGPFTVDGRMVDEPVLAKARRILQARH
jgi:citrate lyase subunit beta/citryl-CoA lyase